MKILSFDQSTKVSGFALFDDSNYISSGVIDLHTITDTSERTKQMGIAICNIIKKYSPDVIIIEEVQQQGNADTLKKLARLQGIAIGFAAAHNIKLYIVEPTKWRKTLGYRQGKNVKREELKQQSFNYVKQNFGFNFSEDRNEAICINIASQKLFNFIEDIVI